MASVRLGRFELEEYDLPSVCAKCGAKAVAAPSKTFSWNPPWVIVLILVGLIPYVIVAMILTKRMSVRLPLCDRHRGYWRNRALFMYGGLLGILLLGVTASILVGSLDQRDGGDMFGLVCAGSAGLFLLWLIAAAIMQATGIRTNEVTDESISLTGLSKDFVDAVREDRRADREERDEEDDRPRARRRDREDHGGYYDPEAKRRRRPDSDAYEEGGERR